MGSDKADIHHLPVVMHRNDQAVIVALDIEHYALIPREAGITMRRLYVRRGFPGCPACVGIPCAQRRFCLRVLRPKNAQRADGYHSHGGMLPRSRFGCNVITTLNPEVDFSGQLSQSGLLASNFHPLGAWAKGLLPGNHIGLPPAHCARTDGYTAYYTWARKQKNKGARTEADTRWLFGSIDTVAEGGFCC